MEHRKAVIFDMDGVIVDSEPHHKQAFYDTIREIGYEGLGGLRFEDYVGRSDYELWVDFVAKNQPPQTMEELLARKRQRIIEVMREVQPIFEGLPDLVAKLAEQCPLAIASGSEHVVIEAVLALKGLRRFFSVVVSSADVQRGKPAPDIFLRAAEMLGVEPRCCWVIEDSKPGVLAALAAGMKVVAITNTHPAHELREATRVVRNYEEIERLLLAA
ncbi:MAG: HAD family phosphatase [Verrucomicrobia bacterium]|nr:HAD family phosphatase [Verrucomicrobiota bacterium]